jgi:hypothetical protein
MSHKPADPFQLSKAGAVTFWHSVWGWVPFALLALIRLWLVSDQRLFGDCGRIYDERVFLSIADHLLSGHWLGPYDHLTLAKGMFYPLWIAATYAIGIPLLLAQHLLYMAACLMLVIAIRPIVHRPAISLLIFGILLFNPMSYSSDVMSTILREGIYPALTLLIAAFAIGLFIRHERSWIELTFWSVHLGLALSAFWLTREEGIWMMPLILLAVGAAAIKIWHTPSMDRRKLSLCVLPFVIWIMSVGIVAGINKVHYGIFASVEFKSPDFLAAYGALSRVHHAHWQPTVTVPLETREQIYEVSPAFAELKPFLEGAIEKRWGNLLRTIRERYGKDPGFAEMVRSALRLHLGRDSKDTWVQMWNNGTFFSGEVFGGWFMWFFRDAAAAAGHHVSGASAAHYYRRLATEINAACADGRLLCNKERATMMPPWHTEYAIPLIRTFFSSILFLARFEDFTVNSVPLGGSEEALSLCRKLTHEQPFPAFNALSHQTGTYNLKTRSLELIGIIYQFAIPLLFGLGSALYILGTVQLFREKTIPMTWIVNTGLLVVIFARLLIISLIHITSFPGIATRLLAPAYPLLLLFIVIAFSSFSQTFRRDRRNIR